MLSVEEARARIAAAFMPLESENVALDDALGRTLARDVCARENQPPAPVSSMDGYAVRSADSGARRLIGTAPAGHPFMGRLETGQAVRIFTGAVVPDGADAVLAQEDAERDGDQVRFTQAPHPGKFIRAAGMDFKAGDVLAGAGAILGARDLALLAAGDHGAVAVHRAPRVAFAATGDELSRAGEERKPGGIVASSAYGLKALLGQWGAGAMDLGILPDNAEALAGIAHKARGADLILTLGGASVGEHDLVRQALAADFTLDFWKVAMRPGKPLIFGHLGATPFLGLPGNPVSTLVTALLFVRPAIQKMLGQPVELQTHPARLSGRLEANDNRQDYLRAQLAWRGGECWAHVFPAQDSAKLRAFARAHALIVREPGAPALEEGASVTVLPLD